jgi:hypothetical protein
MQPPALEGTSHVERTELAGERGHQDGSNAMATVATVAVVGIGAAVFEAALLPGIVLGVAAMWLPRYYPKMGEALKPLFKSNVGGADTANAAVDLLSLVSRAGQLGLRVRRQRRSFAGSRLGFWSIGTKR